MADRFLTRRVRCGVMMAMLAALVAGGLWARPVAAADLEDLDSALKLVPSNASFYWSMMRNGEVYDAVVNSRAWAKINSMPVTAMGKLIWALQAADPESPIGQFQEALDDPETRESVDTLSDAVSHEIFVFGDKNVVDVLELAQQVYATTSYGRAMLQASGEADELGNEQVQRMLALSALAENVDLINVPGVIIGFRLTDPDRARAQLDQLEVLISAELAPDPALEKRFKRQTIDGHEYLTLSLDSDLVPWDEIPLDELKELEAEEGDLDKVVKRIKQLKVVVALGVRDDYLLLAVGPSTKALARLGHSKKRLIDRKELAPLAPHAGTRLTSISYASKPMMARLGDSSEDINELLALVDELLPQAELDEEQKERIRADVHELADDVKSLLPKPAAMLSFSFLVEGGVESYRYDWGKKPLVDGSKPLTLLEHVGANPVLAIVAREARSAENYELMVKWIKRAFVHFEDLLVPKMDEDDRAEYEKVAERALPLLKRLDEANRKMLLPALADGQGAFVLDTKLESRQFHQDQTPTEQPLPMIEPAVVWGVSDRDLLLDGLREYRAVLDEVVDLVRETNPDALPDDYQIPDPDVEQTAESALYSYALPEDWGLDPQIAPTFGLSQDVAVLAASRAHARRLLAGAPLATGGALKDLKPPRAGAAVFDWARLIDAATPWVRYAMQQINQQATAVDEEEVKLEFEDEVASESGDEADLLSTEDDEQPAANPIGAAVVKQVETVLELLKVLQTITAESYFEDGVLVTHSLVEIRDVP